MSEHTTPTAEGHAAALVSSAGYSFETPEGLRALLIRLHKSGHGSWRSDREVTALMRFAAFKYRRLARKYGLDAWEVASAAFETMLHRSTRTARNPWAVVTRSVQITCRAEVRAAGLMMATDRVRHTDRIAGFHDAIRFAERGHLADYHPAFAVTDAIDNADPSTRDQQVAAALAEIVRLFASAGWESTVAADCVEYVGVSAGRSVLASNCDGGAATRPCSAETTGGAATILNGALADHAGKPCPEVFRHTTRRRGAAAPPEQRTARPSP